MGGSTPSNGANNNANNTPAATFTWLVWPLLLDD
jgi:hypothetical protein